MDEDEDEDDDEEADTNNSYIKDATFILRTGIVLRSS
jgi:hypothetical protein